MTEQTPQHAPETELQSFMHYVAQLRAEVSESVAGVLQRGARYVPVGTNPAGGPYPAKATTSAGVFAGYSLTNDSPDTRAVVQFRDGDADGDVFCRVSVPPADCRCVWPTAGGINLTRGLYVEVTAGAVNGSVFLRSGE
jgi:hypothetical protein